MSEDRLFAGLFARGAVAAQTSDRAVLRAMVEMELALLRALVRVGLAPAHAAEGLPGANVLADGLDLGALGRSTAEKGTPVPGLIRALRERLGEHPAVAHLHRGATSQDVVDTAIMLVARRALAPLLEDLGAASERCAEFAERHRASVQPGRTLLQQALPLTFGLKAAVWLAGLDEARTELERIATEELAVQFGGAVGTLAALGSSGLEVMAALAQQLGLGVCATPWHTVRVRPARLACGLAIALGVMAKIARDVVLLAQTEVDEATEGGAEGRGGSSTMPHKHNPVAAVAILACAQRAPGLGATILSAMAPEHERGAGSWQAECEPLLELLRLAGSAAASLRELLDGLDVHPKKMRANLELTDGLVMSESVVGALAESLPRPRAQQLVEQAAQQAAAAGGSLRDALLELHDVAARIDSHRLDQALAPESYLGVSGELIDRALAAHRG